MPFYVYILISMEGYHYIGQTSDLNRRLSEHNKHLAHSTKYGHNWEILRYEQVP